MKTCPKLESVIQALTQKYAVDLAQRNQRLWLRRGKAYLFIDTLEVPPIIGVALSGENGYTQVYVMPTPLSWMPIGSIINGEPRQYAGLSEDKQTVLSVTKEQETFAHCVEWMAQYLIATNWIVEGEKYFG